MSNDKRYPRTIMATACVPWDEDYRLAEDAFRRQVRMFVSNRITHIYIFGTAGEGHAVGEEQFDRIVHVFAGEIADLSAQTGNDLSPMVGLVSLSTNAVIERIKRARDLGIREFQISLPSWIEVSERELFSFVHTVCDPFPDCRFLHFNLANAKRLVAAAEYGRLAGEVPNLVATKNYTHDIMFIYELEAMAPQLRHFNGEAGFAHGSTVGEPGLILTIFNSNWTRAWEFFDAAVDRDFDKLFRMQTEYLELHRELFSVTGDVVLSDGAYDKMYIKLHDPSFPLRLLPPYETHCDESFERFFEVLVERFPQWLPAEDS